VTTNSKDNFSLVNISLSTTSKLSGAHYNDYVVCRTESSVSGIDLLMLSAATNEISMDEKLTLHASDLTEIQTTPCSDENDPKIRHFKQEMFISDSKDSGAMQSQMCFEDCKDFVYQEPVGDYHGDVIYAQFVHKDNILQGAILDLILCPLDASQASIKICRHQCRVCPKIFRYIGGLARHERSHTDSLPYAGRMRTRNNVVVYESHSKKKKTVVAKTTNEDEDNYSEGGESENEQTLMCHHCYKEFDNHLKLNCHVNRIHRGEEIARRSKCSKTEANIAVILDSTAVQFNSDDVQDQADPGPCKTVECTINYSDITGFKHECSICWARFTDTINFESHMKLHMPQQSWLCGLCSENFETESYLRSHYYSEHRRDSTFSCTFCSFKDQKFSHFSSHIRKHTSERPFVCTICNVAFKALKSLKSHILVIHNGVSVYRCHQCSMKFNRDQEELYKLHRESHTDQRPFACTECDKRYRSRHGLQKHVRQVHKKERKYVCTQCDKAYIGKYQRDDHIREIHTGERPYICPYCGKRFSSQNKRFVHENSHNNIVFNCTVCDKTYPSRHGLTNHIGVVHKRERPFSCSRRPKKFKTEINTHMISHTRE